MNKLGCHVSFSKKNNYLVGSIKDGIEYGCNTIMIFMGPPHTSRRVDMSLYNKDLYQNDNGLTSKIKPTDIIAHGPYIINPANPAKIEFAKSFLVSEMERLKFIGGNKFVLHPGSNPNAEIGIKTCAQVIKYALEKVPGVSIAVETMAGKGNEIGINFEQINQILQLVNSDYVGVCMDTCHLWDAGYDVQNIDNVLDEFDKVIGLDKLLVIHLNDSKNKKNAHKDRHANIGKGFIGLDACKQINKNKRLEHINKILETPWVAGEPIYKAEIMLLNSK